nr:hypothetical protein Iba_chr15cCG6750 [Ipomoea batatas]
MYGGKRMRKKAIRSDSSVGNWAWVESDGSVPLVGRQSRGEVQRTASAGRYLCTLPLDPNIGKNTSDGFLLPMPKPMCSMSNPADRNIKDEKIKLAINLSNLTSGPEGQTKNTTTV